MANENKALFGIKEDDTWNDISPTMKCLVAFLALLIIGIQGYFMLTPGAE